MHKIQYTYYVVFFQMLLGGRINAYEETIMAKKVQTCIIEIDNLFSLDKQYLDIVVSSPKVSQNNLC